MGVEAIPHSLRNRPEFIYILNKTFVEFTLAKKTLGLEV